MLFLQLYCSGVFDLVGLDVSTRQYIEERVSAESMRNTPPPRGRYKPASVQARAAEVLLISWYHVMLIFIVRSASARSVLLVPRISRAKQASERPADVYCQTKQHSRYNVILNLCSALLFFTLSSLHWASRRRKFYNFSFDRNVHYNNITRYWDDREFVHANSATKTRIWG